MPWKKNFSKTAFLGLLIALSSCVKDVDLDQYDEIVLSPEAALDLIFFDLTNEEFTGISNDGVTAKDETRLDFLDDDYIQNDLVRVDLNFRFTNTFQSPLTATIRFLSPANVVQHTVVVPIPQGTTENPAVLDYTEIINEGQITRIRRSIRMSVEVTRHDSLAVEGSFQLESKGYFYFEF